MSLRMDRLVSIQHGHPLKHLCTHFTRVQPFPGMRIHVLVQSTAIREHLRTEFTGKGLRPIVPPDVILQMLLVVELQLTLRTLQILLGRVLDHVHSQVPLRLKRRRTVLATERLLLRMRLHMRLQSTALQISLATLRTGEHLRPLPLPLHRLLRYVVLVDVRLHSHRPLELTVAVFAGDRSLPVIMSVHHHTVQGLVHFIAEQTGKVLLIQIVIPNVFVEDLLAVQFLVADWTLEYLDSVRLRLLLLHSVLHPLPVLSGLMSGKSALRFQNRWTELAQEHRFRLPVLVLHLVELLQVAALLFSSFEHFRAELTGNVAATVIVDVRNEVSNGGEVQVA